MKKNILIILLSLSLLPALFASPREIEITDSSDKIFGIAPGLRLSLLGLEPTVSVNAYNLELEAACAFSTGADGVTLGLAPSFSVAYNTNPFEKGTSAAFGLEYMYLTSSYTNLMSRALEKNDDSDEIYDIYENAPGVHSLSLFYKGTHNFNKVFGLLWRIKLPLLILPAEKVDGELKNLNITNFPGFFACTLLGICETSVGVKFMF